MGQNKPIEIEWWNLLTVTLKKYYVDIYFYGRKFATLTDEEIKVIYCKENKKQTEEEEEEAECNNCDWKGTKDELSEIEEEDVPIPVCPDCGSENIYYNR